ncbi:MAG: NUDIX domain-containing protein [Pyrodictiaceae archaeon]
MEKNLSPPTSIADEPDIRAAVNIMMVFSPWPHIVMVEKSSGYWIGDMAFPGGHREPGEDIVDTAIRETVEETCITRNSLKVIGVLGFEAPLSKPWLKTLALVSLYKGDCMSLPTRPCSEEVTRITCVPVPISLETRRLVHPYKRVVVESYKDWYGNVIWGMSLRIFFKLYNIINKCMEELVCNESG